MALPARACMPCATRTLYTAHRHPPAALGISTLAHAHSVGLSLGSFFLLLLHTTPISAHPTRPHPCLPSPPLQGDKTSIWVRNVQLCLFSIPLQFLAVYQRDWEKVHANGWMHGFCPSTWAVVCMFAFGGLLVAVVIRFADNNLKNLAMALAILLSCLASVHGSDGRSYYP